MTGLEEESNVDKDIVLKLDDRHRSLAHQNHENSEVITTEDPLPRLGIKNSIDMELIIDSRSEQSGGQSIEHIKAGDCLESQTNEIESMSENPSERSDLEVIPGSFDQKAEHLLLDDACRLSDLPGDQIEATSSELSSTQADLSEHQSNDQSNCQPFDHVSTRKFSLDLQNSTKEIVTDSIASALAKSADIELSQETHENYEVAPSKDVQSPSSSSSLAIASKEFETRPSSSKTAISNVANLIRDETEVGEQYGSVKPVIRSEVDAITNAYQEEAPIQVNKLDSLDASQHLPPASPAEVSETARTSIFMSSPEFDSPEHESSTSKEEVKVNQKSVEFEPILDQFKPSREIEGYGTEQTAYESGSSAVDGKFSNLTFQSKHDGLFVPNSYETKKENENPTLSSADKPRNRGSPEVDILTELTLTRGQTEDESFAVERTSPHSQKLSTMQHEERGLNLSGNESLQADLENLKKELIRKESSSSISDDDDELLDDPSSSTNSVINTAALSLKSDFLARQLKQRSEDEDYYRRKLEEKESELESAEGKIKALQVRLIRYAKDDRAKDLRLANLEQELNEVTEKMHTMVDMVSSSTGTPAPSNGHGRAMMPAKASSKSTRTKICAIL